MTIQLTCQVCQHPNIEVNTCPNCETDLALVRMLMELPMVEDEAEVSQASQAKHHSIHRPWKNALLFLLLGLVLGAVSTFALSPYSSRAQAPSNLITASALPSPILQSDAIANLLPSPSQTDNASEARRSACTGFRYTVRPGDSLTLMAWRFYGDAEQWIRIAEANPPIWQRTNGLEVGEEVLIPNKEAVCP